MHKARTFQPAGIVAAMCRRAALLSSLFIVLAVGLTKPVAAQAPDLTSGETRTDDKFWNLGPTGMTGWFYHEGASTDKARQIEVISVDAGSPADGILAADDVILGADGTGAEPLEFTSDARKAFAYAIADAEANSPATLKILRWRAGITSTVSIELETLGAYSATAPYNCPKSAAILEKGLDAVMANGGSDNFNLSLLALLAGNDPDDPDNDARMARAQQEAHALILSQAAIDEYTSGKVITTSKIAWTVGFRLVALAEYYLATGDPAVYDSMRAYAIAYANGQSMFGTGGHQFAKPGPDGSINGPYGVGYGVVNSANMQCFYGLLLAREAGVNDQEILDAIERSSRFYGAYVDRGSIPYGEHQPGGGHESNGKMGIAALCFKLVGTSDYVTDFFVKMAGASAKNRDAGHTGPYLNYLWAPLGANVGGEESMAAFFAEQSWHYDLSRNWDGSFEYNSYGQGNNGGPTWSANFQMYLTALLTYATPLRQTYATGKNQDPAKWLTTSEVDAVKLSTNYDGTTRTTAELLDDLGSWSPPTRWAAAREIGNRTAEHATLLPTLHTMATDLAEPVPSRMGACFALGKILDDSSVPVLAGLLTDSENLVRWAASKVLPGFSNSALMAEIDTLLSACASTAKPLLPLDEDDPIHLTHANIVYLVFGSGSAGSPRGVLYGHDLVGIDRNLLYPAVRAAAETPIGLARTAFSSIYDNMSREDLKAVADALVDGTMYEAPADRMFSAGVRKEGLGVMQAHNFSEGVPLSKKVYPEIQGSNDYMLTVLENYAGSSLKVKPDPQIVAFCERLIANGNNVANAQAVLDAIEADQVPDEPSAFKEISWVFADQPELTLPEDWTVLRADAVDHAKGDSVYTWRKVHGAGDVSFTPNGTAEARDTTVVFDGTPGQYLFEVTMSDSRGLTEVSETVAMTLYDTGGNLPANSAPTADAQSLTVGQGAPTPIVLTGTDPEGYALTYTLVNEPGHGVLSGAPPDLVYTANADYIGPDSFTFKVTDSEGQESSVSVDITVDATSDVGLAVYEPFDYPAGGFDGSSGASEIGLDGAWNGDSSINLVAASLNYGTLITGGGSIGNLDTNSGFGGSRTISSSALAGNGLLNDGATLWFSAAMGPGSRSWQRGLFLALANDEFNGNSYIKDDGAQPGSGVGVSLLGGELRATHFRDSSFGTDSHLYGSWDGLMGRALENEVRLVVGKITWGASSDTIEIYLPYEDMVLPETPSSTLTVDVDQSTFDTLTFAHSNNPVFDEIRLGATYQSVRQGTAAMTADTTPPTPDPMNFTVAPKPASSTSITMTATAAFDSLGVEYYFTNTAGGGNDSGWQDSKIYTDTGLTPGVAYSYTVKARDKQPGLNETAASAAASATIPAQATVPETVGMLQATAESRILDTGLTVGTVTTAANYSLTVPEGHILSQTPSEGAAADYGTTVDLVVSIGQDPALPTLDAVDIVDDQSGGPVVVNSLVTYTLTFSEDIDAATVDAADFTNVGDAPISIGTITETSAGVVTVEVTPTGTGLLRFAVAEGATISDVQAEALNTTTAIIDDTTLVVNLPDEIVPDVVGLAQATAESDIVAANLSVGTIYEIHDEVVAAGNVISQDPVAGSSIPGLSPVDLVVSLGPPPDTTGPIVATLDPFDGENNVEVYDDLTVYFDEDVFADSGNIVVRNLSDFTETLIDVTDTSQVRISGVVMTIDPTDDLLAGKSYAVRIAEGAVMDASGNVFAGINDNATWNFSTAVTSQETILFTENFETPDVAAYSEGTTPSNWVRADSGFGSDQHGLTDKAGGDFSAADPNHQAYAFRYGNSGITTVEGVVATIAGDVTYEVTFDVVRDDGKNAGTYYHAQFIAFNAGDARNDARSTDPGILLAEKSGYATDNGSFSTVTLQHTVPAGDASVGMDMALRFRGQSTSANIDNVVFKTVNPDPVDELPPVVTRATPENGGTSFPQIDNLVLNFDEDIVRGSGEIVLKNLSDSTERRISMTDGDQVILSGSTLTINPTEDLLLDKFYAVRIPANAIFDGSSNSYEGIDNDSQWRFSTGEINDSQAPAILSLSPPDDATEVSYRTSLTASFDENVVAGSGNIILKNLTDGTQSTIDVTDQTQVSVSGPDVVIAPANYLGEGKDYAVRMDAGAITDLSGNPHVGIGDDTTWNFAVSATNPPAITSLDPADNAVDVGPASNFTMTFDEDVMAATGNVTIRNLIDATDVVIAITDSSQIAITGNVLTLNPTDDLATGKNHAILVDAGAITDLDGNAFAGIADEATWSFVTGVSAEGAVFTEDFEVASGSPDVGAIDSGGYTSGETGPQWVRANNGFGSQRQGLVDESSGQFTDPTGEQAYAFRYSNTGITTVEGAIGALTTGKTYRVSFYVVLDGGKNDGDSYTAKFVAFDSGAPRDDLRNDNGTMVLASTSGNYSSTTYKLIIFEYTSDGMSDAAAQGKDLALRFKGATTSANIDNIQVAVFDDTTAPTLAPVDIVDDAAGGPVAPNSLVTYTLTFSEDLDGTTVDAADFSNAGTAPVTVGTVTETSPGVFTVEATPTDSGSLQFQVNAGATITDVAGNALDTSSAILDETAITVENSSPVWASDPVLEADATEDAAYASSLSDDASDPDGDAIVFAKVSGPSWLNVASNGDLSGTPVNADVGTNNFTVSVTDGVDPAVEATLTIEVLNTNDAPVADDQQVIGYEDTAVGVSLTASDVDGDALTYTVVTVPLNGMLSGTAPDLTYTPDADYNGSDSFTFTANDGTADSNTATVTLTINAINDAPVFAIDPFNTSDATEDAAYSDTIAGSATDADGETLTYAKVNGPAWLTVAGNGALSGTPLNEDVGGNSFTVSASDGTSTAQATLTIEVLNTNDAPTWNSDPVLEVDAIEGKAYNSSLSDDASDVDAGDTLSYAKVSGPTWLSVATDGALSGTPTNADVGSNSFIVSVTDGEATVQATLTIEVLADTTPPGLTSLSPNSGAVNVATDATLVATFDEPILLKDGGTITITDLTDGSSTTTITLPDSRVTSPNGDDLSIDLGAALDFSNQYEVTIGAAAVEDQASTPNAYTGTSVGEWTFTTRADGIFVTNTGTPTVVDDGSTSATVSDWSLNGGNAVVVLFGGENAVNLSATYGGETMTVVEDATGNRWAGAVAYLINPAASTGDIVLSWAEDGNKSDSIYTPISLGGVAGVNAAASRDTGNELSLNYTTTLNGGYVVGAGTNNSYTGNAPNFSGNWDTVAYQGVVSGNCSVTLVHGYVAAAGSHTDTMGPSPNVESAAGVAFETISAYEDWAGDGSSPTGDGNGDGIADGLAWVVGASDPSSDATELLPTSDTVSEPDYFIFTYRRADEAHNDSNTSIDVIYGEDMSSWTTAVHDGSNVVITETDDYYAPGVDRVEVKLNWNLVTGDSIFARLKVEM